jgi:hypothetical protein
MLEASQDICKLLNADQITLYAVDEDRSAIVSKIKTGLNTARDLKLPIGTQSIAGYVASVRQMVNIADVYDTQAVRQIHPSLRFLKEVDNRSGYRTRRILVLLILDGETLHGVLQVINNKSNQSFGDLKVEGATQLCRTAVSAIRGRGRADPAGQARPLSPHNKARLEKTIGMPYGLFYVCGPDDLHSIPKHLNPPDTKIWPCETSCGRTRTSS